MAEHGTTTKYARGCRCEECRAASAAYGRAHRKAKSDGTYVPLRKTGHPRCSVESCEREAKGKGLCNAHYQQWYWGREVRPEIKKHRRAVDGKRECSRCGEVKPVAEFYVQSGEKRQSACKACASIINRCNRYGVSFDEMRDLLQRPCSGCGRKVSGAEQHIDHCHDSGRVRGVLCHNCNTVLTRHMTPEILRSLADYLESSP